MPTNGVAPHGEPAAGNISRRSEKSASARVLIVDDEALIRWSLAETLTDQGYTVDEASDGNGALTFLRETSDPVDVVLLDYRLPDSHGLQLLTAIRAVSHHSRVVMMTAYGASDIQAEALRLGAVCVVSKPIEMGDVAGLVLQARETATA